MGIKKAVTLFADIVGASEVSNNCSIDEYDEFIDEFHDICKKTRDLIFPTSEYSVEEMESSIKGDEICLILHSGKDFESVSAFAQEKEEDELIKDVKNAILFAVGLKLMWLISEYNRKRIRCWLVPRRLAVGINVGPVMFRVHAATGREKSSEGYTINLAKRIEGIAREGQYSKIFVCKEFRYICEHNDSPVEFDKERLFELTGITTPPYLHEIKDILDSKIVTGSVVMKELEGLPKEDIELYYQTAEVNEQEFWLRKLVAYLLLASKDKRALGLLKKEEVVKNLFEQGNAYYFLNNFDDAVSNYQQILDIDSAFYPASFNLGITYREKGDFDKSLEYLQKALEINPKSEEAHRAIGITYGEKGDFHKSLEYLQKALEINPKSEEAHRAIGITYREKGDFDKSLEYLQKALEINPKSENALVSIGITYCRKGDFDKSLEYLQKALEINPKSEEAHRAIGITYGEKGDFDKFLEYLQKALEINPKSALIHYNIACAYCLKKNKDAAYTFLGKAIELNKQHKKDAREDVDFDLIKGEEQFKKLTSDYDNS